MELPAKFHRNVLFFFPNFLIYCVLDVERLSYCALYFSPEATALLAQSLLLHYSWLRWGLLPVQFQPCSIRKSILVSVLSEDFLEKETSTYTHPDSHEPFVGVQPHTGLPIKMAALWRLLGSLRRWWSEWSFPLWWDGLEMTPHWRFQ